jgi:alpha-tubulin suppressor-like RCC1 family protein
VAAPLLLLAGCSGVGVVETLGNDDTNGDSGDSKADSSNVVSPPTCRGGTGCSIAAGQSSACAITTSGGVRCWGSNLFGQLGIGVATDGGSDGAVDVIGLDGPIVQVAMGDFFACALSHTGEVQCWGDDADGELGGHATKSCSASPCGPTATTVASLPRGIVSIATGDISAYALVDGAIRAWGDDGDGSLGNAGSGGVTAVPVMGLGTAVTAVTGGLDTGCALTTAAGIKCWGWGEYGQMGNGKTPSASVPVDVTGLASGVRAIASGGTHTCALLMNGDVECWGGNSNGELGDGSESNSAVPVKVTGLTDVQALAAASFSTCALTSTDGVKCWGSVSSTRSPVDAPGLSSGVAAIAVGLTQVCALMTSGGVKCLSVGALEPVDVPGFP